MNSSIGGAIQLLKIEWSFDFVRIEWDFNFYEIEWKFDSMGLYILQNVWRTEPRESYHNREIIISQFNEI